MGAIVGIMGRKQAGKDSFAARLVSHHGYTRLGFADALKDAALASDPYVFTRVEGLIRLSDLVADEGWDEAKREPDVRTFLQNLGVAMRDHVGPDVWVEAIRRKAYANPGPVVITDVRFPNEADFVEGSGGILIRVIRPMRLGVAPADVHISEVALDGRAAHLTVDNTGSLADLHRAADEFGAGAS